MPDVETPQPSPEASGLRVLFLTAASRRQILILYEGERLGGCALPPRPPTNPAGPWYKVHVEYRPRLDAPRHGLSVSLDGERCLAPTPLAHWAPTAKWRFGFGARSTSERGRHYVRAVALKLGAQVQSADVPVTY